MALIGLLTGGQLGVKMHKGHINLSDTWCTPKFIKEIAVGMGARGLRDDRHSPAETIAKGQQRIRGQHREHSRSSSVIRERQDQSAYRHLQAPIPIIHLSVWWLHAKASSAILGILVYCVGVRQLPNQKLLNQNRRPTCAADKNTSSPSRRRRARRGAKIGGLGRMVASDRVRCLGGSSFHQFATGKRLFCSRRGDQPRGSPCWSGSRSNVGPRTHSR